MQNCADLKIDLNAKNNHGRTSFNLVCSAGKSKLAKMLMKNSSNVGIDLNSKDNYGWTAFHRACLCGRLNVAQMLMKNSVDMKFDLNARGKSLLESWVTTFLLN